MRDIDQSFRLVKISETIDITLSIAEMGGAVYIREGGEMRDGVPDYIDRVMNPCYTGVMVSEERKIQVEKFRCPCGETMVFYGERRGREYCGFLRDTAQHCIDCGQNLVKEMWEIVRGINGEILERKHNDYTAEFFREDWLDG